MRKNRLHAILSVFLLLATLCSFTLSGCAPKVEAAPILQEEANAIQAALDPLLASRADTLDAKASEYEASGEILKDENGVSIDMPAHIAALRSKASVLRTLTYSPYALAIMDDIYKREYIGEYKSVLSLLPAMVDILENDIQLEALTDESLTTEALIVCYTLAIGDIYASYVDNATAKEEQEMPTSYVGIGVSVTPRDDGYIEVISVTKNSPAEAAGVLPGDILTAVEGDDISDIDYNQVIKLVKGEVDTPVTLTFTRGGKPYTVTMTRRIVENVTVEYKMLSMGKGTTGYLRISEFSASTFDEFVAGIEALEAMGATEFVFDVRSNPGGNAEIVIAILEYILPDDIKHPIVRFNSRDEARHFYSVEDYLKSYSASDEELKKFAAAKNHEITARMAILCNEFTASAGELFTSCLKDFGVAEVYGVTTYGKGLGQSSFRVTDYYVYAETGKPQITYYQDGYFVVPAFYYSPPISDNYHEIGVVPHHEVLLSEEAKQYYISIIPEAIDNQLIAAVTFVQSNKPFTPPPVALEDTLPDGQEDASDSAEWEENTSPSTDAEEKGFFGSSTFIFILFGLLFAALIAVIAYLMIDLRRKAKRERELISSWDDQENDN